MGDGIGDGIIVGDNVGSIDGLVDGRGVGEILTYVTVGDPIMLTDPVQLLSP